MGVDRDVLYLTEHKCQNYSFDHNALMIASLWGVKSTDKTNSGFDRKKREVSDNEILTGKASWFIIY